MAKKGKPLSPKAKLLIGSGVAVVTGGVVVWLFRSGPCGSCAPVTPPPAVSQTPVTPPIPVPAIQPTLPPVQNDINR